MKNLFTTVSRYLQVITQLAITQQWSGRTPKRLVAGSLVPDQMNFLVCRYNPPGNFVGEMPYGNANQAVIDDETTFVPNEGILEAKKLL